MSVVAASVMRVLLESFAAAADVLASWPTLTANGGLTDVLVRATLAASSTPADPGAPAASGAAGPLWTDQLSAYSAAAAAAAAFLTLGVALLAAKYAAGQIAEARTTRREQAQPYVVLYAETSSIDPLAVEIIVKNYGTTAAYRVALDIHPALRRSNFLEGDRREVVDVRIPHVIPILAPGQEYRTLWDHGRYRQGLSLPQEHGGWVTYDDSHGEHHTSPVDLSWHQVHDRTLLERYGPHHSAKALRDIRHILKGWGSHRHGLKVISRDGDAYDARQRAALQAWEGQDVQQDPDATDGGEDQLAGTPPGDGGGGDVEQPERDEAAATRRAQMRRFRAIARGGRTGQR